MLDVAGAAVIVVETEDVDGVSGFAQYHYSGLTFTCSTSGGGGWGGSETGEAESRSSKGARNECQEPTEIRLIRV